MHLRTSLHSIDTNRIHVCRQWSEQQRNTLWLLAGALTGWLIELSGYASLETGQSDVTDHG
jgi:hypothetical protein